MFADLSNLQGQARLLGRDQQHDKAVAVGGISVQAIVMHVCNKAEAGLQLFGIKKGSQGNVEGCGVWWSLQHCKKVSAGLMSAQICQVLLFWCKPVLR